jgi:flavin-dependent dehydrogenase
MDLRLLQRAKQLGVDVHERSIAKALRIQNGEIRGIDVAGVESRAISGIDADLVVDATGRARVLSKLITRSGIGPAKISQNRSASLIAFKTLFRSVDIDPGRCNIFSFPGGYGGLSNIESGLVNLCFLVRTADAQRAGSKPDRILSELIFQNPSARKSLQNAVRQKEWLSAAITGFGKNELNPAAGLLSVGDAAAFNDPFTGSGMLMAFEGAEILAGCMLECRLEPEKLLERYSARFHEKFYLRLRICGALRRLAFVPTLAEAAVVMLGCNRSFAKSVARATRRHSPAAGTDL